MNTTSSDGSFVVAGTEHDKDMEESSTNFKCVVKLVPSQLTLAIQVSQNIAAFVLANGDFDRVNYSVSSDGIASLSELYDDSFPFTSSIVTFSVGNVEVKAEVLADGEVVCSDRVKLSVASH